MGCRRDVLKLLTKESHMKPGLQHWIKIKSGIILQGPHIFIQNLVFKKKKKQQHIHSFTWYYITNYITNKLLFIIINLNERSLSLASLWDWTHCEFPHEILHKMVKFNSNSNLDTSLLRPTWLPWNASQSHTQPLRPLHARLCAVF